jgi:hypothetical protein
LKFPIRRILAELKRFEIGSVSIYLSNIGGQAANGKYGHPEWNHAVGGRAVCVMV